MKSPEKFLFELRQRDKLWRINLVEYQGEWRLSVWPWFEKDGEWFPCAARFGGGFQVPLNRLPELVEALQTARAEGGAA